MSNEMTLQERPQMTAVEIRAQVNLIQEVMRAVMKKDTHYGTIPGCAKPSLWKPGAEVLMMTFHIASEAEVIDLSTTDEAKYRVVRRGTTRGGAFVGSGIGECSSNEEKYKWRRAVCDGEWNETPEDRRREKWFKDGSKVKQVRTVPADVANTVLKMADKRAYVGLTLNVTAASDIFVQDVEDLPEGTDLGEQVQAKPPIHPPQAKKPETKVEGNTLTFIPVDVKIKDGTTKDNKPYRKYNIIAPDAKGYGTFDAQLGALAAEAKEKGQNVELTFIQKGDYFNVTALSLVA